MRAHCWPLVWVLLLSACGSAGAQGTVECASELFGTVTFGYTPDATVDEIEER